jgi:hypothetical protein
VKADADVEAACYEPSCLKEMFISFLLSVLRRQMGVKTKPSPFIDGSQFLDNMVVEAAFRSLSVHATCPSWNITYLYITSITQFPGGSPISLFSAKVSGLILPLVKVLISFISSRFLP